MANEAELAFVKKLAANLAEQPVTYHDDFQPPLDQYLKKVPVLQVKYSTRFSLWTYADLMLDMTQIPVPPPPERKEPESGPTGELCSTTHADAPSPSIRVAHPQAISQAQSASRLNP